MNKTLLFLTLILFIIGAYYYSVYSPYRILSQKAKELISNHQIDLDR